MARGSILARAGTGGDVTYSIKYRVADGTQVKRTIGTSRRDAEKALTAALAAVDRGELRSATRETFREYQGRWLTDHAARVEHSTFVDYSNTLRNHLVPCGCRRSRRSTSAGTSLGSSTGPHRSWSNRTGKADASSAS